MTWGGEVEGGLKGVGSRTAGGRFGDDDRIVLRVGVYVLGVGWGGGVGEWVWDQNEE